MSIEQDLLKQTAPDYAAKRAKEVKPQQEYIGGIPVIRNPYGNSDQTKNDQANQVTTMPVQEPVQKERTNEDLMNDLRGDLINQAQNFRKNYSSYATDAFKPIESAEKRRLAEGLAGIKSGAQSRGLLYSGARQRAEGEQYADTASNLAQQRMSINKSFLDQANQMENEALQSNLDARASKQQQEDMLYQRALEQYRQRNQAIGGLASGAGGLIGTILGGK